MLARIADKLILKPTTHPIPTKGKTRQLIKFDGGQFEVWQQCTGEGQEPDIFVLKFPGTGGRAERANEHPAECWPDLAAEIWVVNPPGYGGSSGRASVRNIAGVASAVFREIVQVGGGKPLIVTGNSLGAVAALYVAARHDVDGLLLRNPPPLRQLISGHHGRWSLGLSRLIARQLPDEICSIRNASQANVPAVFVMSEKDRTVPPKYQQQIIDQHDHESRLIVLPGAGHADPMDEAQQQLYAESLLWLLDRAIENHRRRTTV